VFALGDDDLLPDCRAASMAWMRFLKTEDGKNLLVGFKRAGEFLAAEEKKGRGSARRRRAGLGSRAAPWNGGKALDATLSGAIPRRRRRWRRKDFAAPEGARGLARPGRCFRRGRAVMRDGCFAPAIDSCFCLRFAKPYRRGGFRRSRMTLHAPRTRKRSGVHGGSFRNSWCSKQIGPVSAARGLAGKRWNE